MSLERHVVEHLQTKTEEVRQAMAQHCEQVGTLRRALREVMASNRDFLSALPKDLAALGHAHMREALRAGHVALGE